MERQSCDVNACAARRNCGSGRPVHKTGKEDKMELKRNWDVLIIGGASGVGKSCVSYALAKKYEIGITEVDDFQCVLEDMTKEEDYPVLHYWKNHFEEALAQPFEKKLEIMCGYAKIMSRALELVIANHLESDRPFVLEGDFITPELCTMSSYASIEAGTRVRSLIIAENDESQIIENYRVREGSLQQDRAHLSWLYNGWLCSEAKRLGVAVIEARPWHSVLERICENLDKAPA